MAKCVQYIIISVAKIYVDFDLIASDPFVQFFGTAWPKRRIQIQKFSEGAATDDFLIKCPSIHMWRRRRQYPFYCIHDRIEATKE